MRRKSKHDFAEILIRQYGVLLSVEDLAQLFNFSTGDAVRKAHRDGRLPVKLRKYKERRGLYTSIHEVIDVVDKIGEYRTTED